tara:strand:- start:104 stop:514 length:411 start_codon:yes stop_codon:yes gene_type:complete
MIANFGGILNLVLFLLSLLGFAYYAYLCVFSPNTIIERYEFGEKAVPIVRIISTFVLPTLIIGVWILFRENGPQGCWIFFVYGALISLFQVLLSWAQRLKIIDPDAKSDVADDVIGHVFLAIAVYLIYSLSDVIYM